jgi:hypothetical protein
MVEERSLCNLARASLATTFQARYFLQYYFDDVLGRPGVKTIISSFFAVSHFSL